MIIGEENIISALYPSDFVLFVSLISLLPIVGEILLVAHDP